MRDDGDEIAGMANTQRLGGMSGEEISVTVTALQDCVRLNIGNQTYKAGLTVAQARYLARKLYRMARIVEQRMAGS